MEVGLQMIHLRGLIANELNLQTDDKKGARGGINWIKQKYFSRSDLLYACVIKL